MLKTPRFLEVLSVAHPARLVKCNVLGGPQPNTPGGVEPRVNTDATRTSDFRMCEWSTQYAPAHNENHGKPCLILPQNPGLVPQSGAWLVPGQMKGPSRSWWTTTRSGFATS